MQSGSAQSSSSSTPTVSVQPRFLKGTGQNGGDPIQFPTSLLRFPKYIPSTEPPIPPNWTELCSKEIPKLPWAPFYKFPLDPDSAEYQTLAWMVEPSCNIQITEIQQIINQGLWNKFVAHRKETMLMKCENVKILSGFGVTVEDLTRILNQNPTNDTELGGVPYSDNICLLYHCTRRNPESIWEEGLDERVGKPGNLGRGIYFSDDPLKAMDYDGTGGTLLVFMVYLGDCLSSTEIENVTSSTREPKKVAEQQRSKQDRTFDSIAGAPFREQNEFVIFNRSQCVPVFSIKYVRQQDAKSSVMTHDFFYLLRRSLPEFIWKEVGDECFATPGQVLTSALHAGTIFDLMKTFKKLIRISGDPVSPVKRRKLEENAPDEKNASPRRGQKRDANGDESKSSTISGKWPIACSICCEVYSSDESMKNLTNCGHSLCIDCYKEIEKSGTTMSGQVHTFLKCPFCSKTTGVQIGSCPDGTMISTYVTFKNVVWIQINYTIPTHGQIRVAFLPSTVEGRKVLDLLKTAWERRIIFAIGTSLTTGKTNTPVWNIHHKSATEGGPANYGYPDEGYLGRVKEELKQYGIE